MSDAKQADVALDSLPTFDDPGAMRQAASAVAAAGHAVSSAGDTFHSTWQTLGGHYLAPETDALLAATRPSVTDGSVVKSDAQLASNALNHYADSIDELQRRADALRARVAALDSHIQSLDLGGVLGFGEKSWREVDPGAVADEAACRAELDAIIKRYKLSQAVCADSLYTLFQGVSPRPGMHVPTPDVTEAAPAPTPPPKPDSGWGFAKIIHGDVADGLKDFAHKSATGVEHFASGVYEEGKGFVDGTADMLGLHGSDAFKKSWSGIYQLGAVSVAAIGGDRNAQDKLKEIGKSVIHLDEWAKDPAKALGMTVFDVGTLVVGGGGGAALKGGVTAARASELAAVVERSAMAGRVVEIAGAARTVAADSRFLTMAGRTTMTGVNAVNYVSSMPMRLLGKLPPVRAVESVYSSMLGRTEAVANSLTSQVLKPRVAAEAAASAPLAAAAPLTVNRLASTSRRVEAGAEAAALGETRTAAQASRAVRVEAPSPLSVSAAEPHMPLRTNRPAYYVPAESPSAPSLARAGHTATSSAENPLAAHVGRDVPTPRDLSTGRSTAGSPGETAPAPRAAAPTTTRGSAAADPFAEPARVPAVAHEPTPQPRLDGGEPEARVARPTSSQPESASTRTTTAHPVTEPAERPATAARSNVAEPRPQVAEPRQDVARPTTGPDSHPVSPERVDATTTADRNPAPVREPASPSHPTADPADPAAPRPATVPGDHETSANRPATPTQGGHAPAEEPGASRPLSLSEDPVTSRTDGHHPVDEAAVPGSRQPISDGAPTQNAEGQADLSASGSRPVHPGDGPQTAPEPHHDQAQDSPTARQDHTGGDVGQKPVQAENSAFRGQDEQARPAQDTAGSDEHTARAEAPGATADDPRGAETNATSGSADQVREHPQPRVAEGSGESRLLTHADGETTPLKLREGVTTEQVLPDGSRVILHDDGHVVVQRSSSHTDAVPGGVVDEGSKASITEHWDGSKKQDVHIPADGDGNAVSPRPGNHVITTAGPDGKVTVVHDNGTVSVADTNTGTVQTLDHEGTLRTTTRDGVTTTHTGDNVPESMRPSGDGTPSLPGTDKAHGMTTTSTSDGTVSATAPGGATATTHGDGAHSVIGNDGTVVKRTADGQVHVIQPDGTGHVVDASKTAPTDSPVRVTADGEVHVEHADGSRTVVASDHIRHESGGHATTAHQDGRVEFDHGGTGGTRVAPDGTSYHVDADGHAQVKGDPRLSSAEGSHNSHAASGTLHDNLSDTGLTHNGVLHTDVETFLRQEFPPGSHGANLQEAIGTKDNPGPIGVADDGRTLYLREPVTHDFTTDNHTAEFSRQVQMQGREVQNLTQNELDHNRDAYAENRETRRMEEIARGEVKARGEKYEGARTPVYGEAETRKYRNDVITARAQEIQAQARALGGHLGMDDAKAAARNQYSNWAALHGPDRIVGGYKDLFTGFGDGHINSALGSHWKDSWRDFDEDVVAALTERRIPTSLWGDFQINVKFTINGRAW